MSAFDKEGGLPQPPTPNVGSASAAGASPKVNQPLPNPTQPASASWDPESIDPYGRRPSKECLKRLRQDYKRLLADELTGIYCIPDPDDCVTRFYALIVGPFDTPYEGGFFLFLIDFPDDYPNNPPKVKNLTTGAGSWRAGPNLYSNGKVCLSILGTWSGPSWCVVQNLSSVLLSIQSLLNENPLYNEPGYESGSSKVDLRQVLDYNEAIRHECLRVAVLDLASPGSSMHQRIPDQLKGVIADLFPSLIYGYVLTCRSNLYRDGKKIYDPLEYPALGKERVYQYGKLLEGFTELAKVYGCEEALLSEEATTENGDMQEVKKEGKEGGDKGGGQT